ncbi:hypothetical protein [Stappia indica]|uniref:Uncharacterized protein n=1 Tax=Stappia indica TaxID=538381 RepID=A0A285TJ53_9HYPH|nr:hypothetical protein [Stappia indica]SOC22322.1 hypothetical protein SAMN05421512_11244 [Stappia indica]
MKELYAKALMGQLYATETTTAVTIQVHNNLPVRIAVYNATNAGTRQLLGHVEPGSNGPVTGTDGDYLVIASAISGSFISAYALNTSESSYTVDNSVLTTPNDIGSIPVPTTDVLVPVNSPLVMVAISTISPDGSTTNYITREQFWNLQGDSYSLAVGESRTVSYTIVSGRQTTSSTQDTVGASIGVDAHAGWGPISAGISASLNAESTTFQQVTVNEQTTSYMSDTVTNSGDDDVAVLRWQMTDVITIFSPSYQPLASIVSGLNPIIVKSYNVSDLINPEQPTDLVARQIPVTMG